MDLKIIAAVLVTISAAGFSADGPSSATITRDPADKVVQWSTVTLSCAVDTANPPVTYTWTRVNGTLPTNTDVDQIAGTLRLRSIQPDAVGTYQCSATNRIGDPAIATHVIDEVEEVHNDKCYRQSRDALSHKEASAACVFMGGQLVDITQSHEQQMLTDIIRNTNDVSHWTFIKSETPTLLHIDGSPMSLQSSWMAEDMYGPFDICVLLDRDQSYKGDFHACTEQHNYVCESPVTPCHPDVCQHGGVCKSCFSESPMCDCPPGYNGVFCETDINECASNPCQNGVTCLDRVTPTCAPVGSGSTEICVKTISTTVTLTLALQVGPVWIKLLGSTVKFPMERKLPLPTAWLPPAVLGGHVKIPAFVPATTAAPCPNADCR